MIEKGSDEDFYSAISFTPNNHVRNIKIINNPPIINPKKLEHVEFT